MSYFLNHLHMVCKVPHKFSVGCGFSTEIQIQSSLGWKGALSGLAEELQVIRLIIHIIYFNS